MSRSRRRRRRWPLALAALVALAGAGGAAYLTVGRPPADVVNPGVEFEAPPPPKKVKKPRKRPDRRVLWPVYGYTPARTRYLDANLRPPFRRVWTVAGSRLMEFPPVLAKGTLFYVKNTGEAYAVSTRTGMVRWRRRIGYLSASSPAWSKGRLFITLLRRAPGRPGRVVSLHWRTGRIRWAKDLPSRTESSPLAMDGRVYLGSEDGTIYALRARDGRTVWTYRTAGAVKGGLAYSDGRLYFGDYSGQVTAIRVRDGSRVWSTGTAGRSFNRSGRFYSTPAVAFGRVYVGNTDGKVYSFSARTGQLAWRRSTGGYVYASPAVADVPRLGPTVFIGSYDGSFYALDARSGATRWRHHAGGKISGAATLIGDVVYFSNLSARSTTGLDARTGRPVFAFGRGAFNPAISDGKRLYLTGYSSQYAFEPKRRGKRRSSADRRRRREGST